MRITTHHKKPPTKKTTTTTSVGSGGAIVNALHNDPAALATLVQDIASALFSSGFSQEIILAIEAVVGSAQASGAGRLIAGTVSNLAGALQLNGSSQPIIAMVFLNGAATAVPVYVPTHIRATIATSQEVWVMPVNGRMDDLMIFSIRNVF